MHGSTPLESILFPLLLLNPLAIDDDNDDDGVEFDSVEDDDKERSFEFTLELVDSFPFRMGFK